MTFKFFSASLICAGVTCLCIIQEKKMKNYILGFASYLLYRGKAFNPKCQFYLWHAWNHPHKLAHRTHLSNCTSLLQKIVEVKLCSHYLLLQIFSIFLTHLSNQKNPHQIERKLGNTLAMRIIQFFFFLKNSQLLVPSLQKIKHLPFPIFFQPFDLDRTVRGLQDALLVPQA